MRTYTVVIDEDVPISKKGLTQRSRSRYVHPLSWLLPKLKPGNSFVYPASTGEKINCLRAIATGYAKRHGIKVTTRIVTDREGVDRLRIWRVK